MTSPVERLTEREQAVEDLRRVAQDDTGWHLDIIRTLGDDKIEFVRAS